MELISLARETFSQAWRREGGQVVGSESPICSSPVSLTGSFNCCVVGRRQCYMGQVN